jgi:voltage-gated potassium channel
VADDLDPQRPEPPPGARTVLYAAVRAVGSVVVLMLLYYLLPLDHSSTGVVIAILVIGLAGLITLVVFQVRWILVSRHPTLRAVEALATSIPLFLLLFAGSYYLMARYGASNFGGPMTRTDSLYFSVTVFSTVGFGDITAKSEVARRVVTAQMATDLVVVGIAVKVILGAATHTRQHRRKMASVDQ